MTTPTTKMCSACKQERPLPAFGYSKNTKDGRARQCARCKSRENAERRERQRTRANTLRLRLSEYGASEAVLGLIRVNDARALAMFESIACQLGIPLEPTPEDQARVALLADYRRYLLATVGEGCKVQLEAKDLYSVETPQRGVSYPTLASMARRVDEWRKAH